MLNMIKIELKKKRSDSQVARSNQGNIKITCSTS